MDRGVKIIYRKLTGPKYGGAFLFPQVHLVQTASHHDGDVAVEIVDRLPQAGHFLVVAEIRPVPVLDVQRIETVEFRPSFRVALVEPSDVLGSQWFERCCRGAVRPNARRRVLVVSVFGYQRWIFDQSAVRVHIVVVHYWCITTK